MKLHSTIRHIAIMLFFLLSTQTYAFSSQDLNSYFSDATITAQIRAKIASDLAMSNFKMDVETVNGVVALGGVLDSDAQARTLIQMAQAVSGVKNINVSKLSVKDSEHSINDLVIAAKISGLFSRERIFSNKVVPMITIKVEANNGIVQLNGTAISKEQEEKAVAIAESVQGVKSVESSIEIINNKSED